VKEMSKRVTFANTLSRAQRELKMVRRIVILVIGVTTIGFPYALFILMSFFNRAPKYHLRIAYMFINLAMVFVMVALFQFTDPLKSSIMKRIKRRTNVIVPRVA
jgi:predicted membrane protein